MATQKLTRGMGTLFKRCDCERPTRCAHSYTIRYRDIAGKPRERSGFANQADAIAELTTIYNEKRSAPRGSTAHREREEIAEMRYQAYMETWLKQMKRRWTGSTYPRAVQRIECHLIPRLGSRRVGTFSKRVVEDLLRDMEDDGVGLGTQRNVFRHLKASLEYPKAIGAVQPSLFEHVIPPDYQPDEIAIPTTQELHDITLAAPEGLKVSLALMSGCGARNGESYAPNINNIVADDAYRITEQLNERSKYAPLKHRKRGDFREVPLPSATRSILLQAAERYGTDNDGYIRVPDKYGRNRTVVPHKTYTNWWDATLREIGIGGKYRMYSLRHFFASNCLTHGIPITDVADWMGHGSIEVTYQTYRHLMPSSISKAAKVLDQGLVELSA